jgi:outer membrane receptor protein involved in Fe transport
MSPLRRSGDIPVADFFRPPHYGKSHPIRLPLQTGPRLLPPVATMTTLLHRPFASLLRALAATALVLTAAFAADEARRAYNLPAGEAPATLRRWAEISGRETLFAAETVRGVRTNAVQGDLTAADAIARLLAGTPLTAVPDAQTGAFAIRVASAAPATGPARSFTASAASVAAASAREEAIQLSVFEVAADKDDSYGSTTSTSITGTRKELRRMPVAAEVMNRALLDDLGAVELREILEFAPGVGAFLISGGTADVQGNQAGDRIGNEVGSLRGLSVSTRRNGFQSNASSFDGFSKDRLEIIRGPQALLYGPTNASGIIVVNTKRPNLRRNAARLTLRTDSEGSRRGEFEGNVSGQIGQGEQRLGLLVASFQNQDKFWRVNNEIEANGFYLAGAWRLTPRLTLRSDFERVHRHAIDPTTIRLTAPANNATYGSRNNLPLRLLLAQGRAGDLYNGGLNYANADAFGLDSFAEIRDSDIFSAQLEAQVLPWLSVLLQGGFSDNDRIRYNNAAGTNLTPPGLGANPLAEWAVQINPNIDPIRSTEKSFRVIANVELPKWRWLKSEFSLGAERRLTTSRQLGERWFEIDASGEFIRNAAALNNALSGRTVTPAIWWAPARQGYRGPEVYRSAPANTIEIDGRRYRRDVGRNQFPQFVTADNPLGYSNGSAGININDRDNDAAFASWSGEWLGGRLDTLAGYRFDWLDNSLVARPFEDRTFAKGSHMLGLNWHLTRRLTAYYAHSTSFQPGGTGLTPANTTVPEGSGVGDEVGLKFSFLEEKITGAVSFYSSKAKNNTANLPTDFQNIIDPSSGVNGRRNGGLAYLFDRQTEGYEVNLTAAPIKGLRLQGSFSHIKAREGADVIYPIYYNDQFNVNAAGQVTLGNGTPLQVPIATNTPGWNPASPTPGVPAQILTVAMLRGGDANGNYRASLNANSGAITNAGALYLNTPTVGTGTTGLPIARHQLGFVPPSGSTFLIRQGGDRTTGYATNSFSLTTNYRIPEGRLRGLAFGGNYRIALDQLGYYYTDRQTNPAAPVRRLYITPNQQNVTLFFSYDFRFKRGFVWRTQLNIANALDEVKVITYPNLGDGSPENVRLTNPPRVWAWSNTFRF